VLLSLSLLGLILQHSPSACTPHRAEGQLLSALTYALTAQVTASSKGAALVNLCTKLSNESLSLAAVGILSSLWFTSRLFVKIENAFGVIFRLPSRGFLSQNGIALGMAALFTVLGPLSLMLSVAPAHLLGLARHTSTSSSLPGYLVGALCGTLVTFLLLMLIYMIVPAQRVRFGDAWKGALVAPLLLSLYEEGFPLYAHFFATANISYGTAAGLVALLLVFFYYFTVIVLLGAEINAWSRGHQEASGDIATVLAQVGQGATP
jgi:YihY family inner membrane protein